MMVPLGESLSRLNPGPSEIIPSACSEQDTLMNNQHLYTGRVWVNKYRRINGDPFLFASYFLPGTVSVNGKTYRNLKLRYDIYNDELMIPVNLEDIVELNKEMVDSFSLNFENKTYKFTKIHDDSIDVITGFFYIPYDRQSALYIKYKKHFLQGITGESDGEFVQTQTAYLVKNDTFYRIKTRNSLFRTLNLSKSQVRNYLRENRVKIKKYSPESYVPVIRLSDDLNK
jgi:hypothetical protein